MSDEPKALRVLLVEDHPATGEMTIEMISMLGHAGRRVASLLDAEAAVRSDAFDLVLTDYRLPDGTGIELVRRLHATAAGRTPPCILLSAYDRDSLGLPDDVPFVRVLLKPVMPAQLAEAFASLSN